MADLDITLKRKTGAVYDNLHPTTTWTQVESKPTTFTPTAHTHGNITNTGVLNNTPVTVGTGDFIVIGDTSSAVVERSTIAFGTATTTFLRNDGAWATPAGGGTVTSVSAGNGMNFTAITGSGSVTMGTPSTLTTSTTNSVTSTSHTHAVTFPVTSVSSLTGAVDLSPSILGSTATVTSTGATVTVTTNQVVANGRYRFTYIINTASTNNASTPRGTFEIEMPPTLSTSHHIGIVALGNFIPSNTNNDTSLYFRFAVRYATASSFFITGINGSRVNSSVLYNDTYTNFNLYITNIERIYY
jgi:hypothetical protein